MLLSNFHIAGQTGLKHLSIENGRILDIAYACRQESRTPSPHAAAPGIQPSTPASKMTGSGPHLLFEKAIAFPGLINSHDHLDFNLFPRLGNRVYENYLEWGSDIHQNDKATIGQVLQIPQALRIRWSLYKNLLNGVTTVVNHGAELPVSEDLISVYQEACSLHSVGRHKGWRSKLLHPFRSRQPVVIHIGEGTDPVAAREIDTLIKWNLFKRTLIGIHGVAMNEKQASAFQALIWCPDSNYFLFNTTAPVNHLKTRTRILFGTDSTLTASWNLWEQLRLARYQGMTGDTELLDMLTKGPADIWGMTEKGSLNKHQSADLVIARTHGQADGWDAFYAINPEDILLVLHQGNIQLFDQELYGQLVDSSYPLQDFSRIRIRSHRKYIRGNLPGLMQEIRKFHPGAVFPIEAD